MTEAAAPPVFRPDLRINPAAAITVRHIGSEKSPLLIIDDLLATPNDFVEVARRVPFNPPPSMYPGLNAPLPPPYFRVLLSALQPLLHRVFDVPPDRKLTAHGFFALALRSGDDLHVMQRVPHQDTFKPDRLGMVHFLCHGEQGGTGFFRHRATGFETVDQKRTETFAPIIDDEARALVEDGRGVEDFYEMFDSADAVFNRLIVYPAHLLHTGLLGQSTLTPDPSKGRLTANIFLGEGPPE